MSVNPFLNRTARRTPVATEAPAPLGVLEMALDTLGTIVRTIGEFALDQQDVEPQAFTQLSENWAQHLLVGSAPPGSNVASSDGRRDWAGVRECGRGGGGGGAGRARAGGAGRRRGGGGGGRNRGQ